jgi:hypothetical protein
MSIAAIVTRGFAFGAIAAIVTRGYALGASAPVPVAIPAPGPLLLSPKAYRDLVKRRRRAEAEIDKLRRADDARRAGLRAMVARAVRGEAEPAAEQSAQQDAQRAPNTRPTEARPPVIRKSRTTEIPAPQPEPADEVSPRIALLTARLAGLEAAIAAHRAAQEDDDIEALLLLAA